MNQLRHELRAAGSLGVTHSPEPIQYGRAVRIRVLVALQVRVDSFAHDQIEEPVAVDVGVCRGMRLGHGDAVRIRPPMRSSMMTCSTNEIAPFLSRLCSYQPTPHP